MAYFRILRLPQICFILFHGYINGLVLNKRKLKVVKGNILILIQCLKFRLCYGVYILSISNFFSSCISDQFWMLLVQKSVWKISGSSNYWYTYPRILHVYSINLLYMEFWKFRESAWSSAFPQKKLLCSNSFRLQMAYLNETKAYLYKTE